MKILLTLMLTLFLSSSGFSQDRYTTAMKKNIALVDSVYAKNNAAELAHNFERIAQAEKDKWLPYYYAAYLTVIQALSTQDVSKNDEIADKAEALLSSAENILGKDNSEIYVIKSMIATARMIVDPQNRYMLYGQDISANAKKAEMLDPSNPRPVLLEAQNLLYTPEAFGGGKTAAQPLFEKAAELFNNFKPESELSPMWGKPALTYFLQTNK